MVQLETKLLLETTVLTATGIGLFNLKQDPDISYAADTVLTLTSGALLTMAAVTGAKSIPSYASALFYRVISKAKEGYETLADLTLLVGNAVSNRYYRHAQEGKVLATNEKITS